MITFCNFRTQVSVWESVNKAVICSSHRLLVERVQLSSRVFAVGINAAFDDIRNSLSDLIAGKLCC